MCPRRVFFMKSSADLSNDFAGTRVLHGLVMFSVVRSIKSDAANVCIRALCSGELYSTSTVLHGFWWVLYSASTVFPCAFRWVLCSTSTVFPFGSLTVCVKRLIMFMLFFCCSVVFVVLLPTKTYYHGAISRLVQGPKPLEATPQ